MEKVDRLPPIGGNQDQAQTLPNLELSIEPLELARLVIRLLLNTS